jgi:hypothetical protein
MGRDLHAFQRDSCLHRGGTGNVRSAEHGHFAVVEFQVQGHEHLERPVDVRRRDFEIENLIAGRIGTERVVEFIGGQLRAINVFVGLWLPSRSISRVMCFSTIALNSSVVAGLPR